MLYSYRRRASRVQGRNVSNGGGGTVDAARGLRVSSAGARGVVLVLAARGSRCVRRSVALSSGVDSCRFGSVCAGVLRLGVCLRAGLGWARAAAALSGGDGRRRNEETPVAQAGLAGLGLD